MLDAVARPGVDLAVWQRDADPVLAAWLESVPREAWPACRVEVGPDEVPAALAACFDDRATPDGHERQSLIADMARLVAMFASVAEVQRMRVRLDAIKGDACRRWHRDCVPLRLICTYLGPGTQWVGPVVGDHVLSRPDDDTSHALTLGAADVALFKGCGWPGQPHDGGIVHRSPRIAGTGSARLVLVLDAAWPGSDLRRP